MRLPFPHPWYEVGMLKVPAVRSAEVIVRGAINTAVRIASSKLYVNYCVQQAERGGVLGESLPDLRQPGVVGCVRVGKQRGDGGDPEAGGVRAAYPSTVLQPLQLAELRPAGDRRLPVTKTTPLTPMLLLGLDIVSCYRSIL